ncbi:MAG: hypothetical protein M3Q53_04405, partial [Actinomycetota bacterium]|nr:hypothetical protein [Actinomycetota bacterium]
ADVRDAHSIELETLSELGIPGFIMLAAGLGGSFAGAWRSRRAGPAAAGLTAVALASATYWLLHSSVDWFWPYPAISAPVLALLGASCAPAVMTAAPGRRRAWRVAALAAAAVLALSAVPVLAAERYVDAAYGGWRENRELAYANLDRAASLNPLSEEPLLAEGGIARAAGDSERAIEAFREATAKRPEEWAAHYFIADLSAAADPVAARAEVRIALTLNPNSVPVRKLAERLGITPPPLSYDP